jgi:hypothetical protein
VQPKICFDRWSNLVWKWKQHRVNWICHTNSTIKMFVIPEAYECLVPGLILDMYSLNDPTLFMSLCDFTTFLTQLWQILPFLFVSCSNLFCIWTYAISIPSPSPAIQLILEGEKFLGRNCFSCSGRFLGD